MVDLIKEASELANFIQTDEQAQLYIVISLVGAAITATTSVILSYLTRRQS